MELEYSGELKSEYPYNYKRQEFIIEIYDSDVVDKEDEPIKIGVLSGYYYDSEYFGGLMEMLEYADFESLDESQILQATILEVVKAEPVNKRIFHNFITVDGLYILKEYRGRGYATETMKNIKHIISSLFHLEADKTVVGLIASPFELEDNDETKLDLDLENMNFLDDDDRKNTLFRFYTNAGLKQSKSDPIVYYDL